MPLQKSLLFSWQAAQYVNEKILESTPAEKDLFDILVLSNNSPESGARIINSAKHYGKGNPSPAVHAFPQETVKQIRHHSGASVANTEPGDRRGRGCFGNKPNSCQPHAACPVCWSTPRVQVPWQSPAPFGRILCIRGSGSILHSLGILRQLLKKQSS